MKSCSIALSLACLAAGPVLAKDHVPEQAPIFPAGQALGAVVAPAPLGAPAPEVADVHGPRLRDSLRQPVNVQPADGAPYRMSDDERRKMREWLRSQGDSPLRR